MTFGRKTQVKLLGGTLIARTDAHDDDASLMRDLRGMKRRFGDFSAPFERWVPKWFRQERQVFREQGIPRWQRLKPSYAAKKRREYPNKGILRREDRLWRSLTTRTRDTIVRPGPRSLQLGTRVPYSDRLQETRPHVVIMSDTFEELNRIALEHLLNQPVRGRARVR